MSTNVNKRYVFRSWKRGCGLPPKGFMVLFIFGFLVVVASSSQVIAANHYIRDGGNGNGTDWNNAWDDLPSSLTRGDTYYVADGTYGAYQFNDAASGSLYITIKKAIESDHGTDTGWSSAYGDGVATFTSSTSNEGVLRFYTDYYIFDGQVGGGPSNWYTGHGFRVEQTSVEDTYSHSYLIAFIDPSKTKIDDEMSDYITLSHIDLELNGVDGSDFDLCLISNPLPNTSWNSETKAVFPGQPGPTNITISYCYFHESPYNHMNTKQGSDWLVEYNCFARTSSEPLGQHGTCWQEFGSSNITVRYNLFEDIEGSAVLDLKKNTNLPNIHPDADENYHVNNNWDIYGNIFWYRANNPANRSGVGEGIFGTPSPSLATTNNINFYNNTIINWPGWHSGFRVAYFSNINVYNNIWYACWRYIDASGGGGQSVPNVSIEGEDGTPTYNYNAYIYSPLEDGFSAAANDIEAPSGADPFTGWVNGDFNLNPNSATGQLAIDSGIELPWMNNIDMYGNIRGGDGNWDRGAIEFDKGTALGNIYHINWDGTGDFITINSFAQVAQPGDTGIIHSGTYTEQVRPANSGTQEFPITFIAEGEVVVGSSAGDAFELGDRNYVVIDGLTFRTPRGCIDLNNANNNTIQNNIFDQVNVDISRAMYINNGTYNKILNNRFINANVNRYNDYIEIYRDSQYNLVEGNYFSQINHDAVMIYSREPSRNAHHNIIRNNVFDDMWWKAIGVHSNTYTLIEYNTFSGVAANFVQLEGEKVIMRNNLFDDLTRSPAQSNDIIWGAIRLWSGYYATDSMVKRSMNDRIYSNVFNNNERTITSINGELQYPSDDNIFKNNILYNNDQTIYLWYENYDTANRVYFNNNLLYGRNPGEDIINLHGDIYNLTEAQSSIPTLYSGNIEENPLFVNEAGKDYQLQAGSPAIDAGADLTYTTSAGTGTVITVEDALYFVDGWGVIEADDIQVGLNSPVTITNVDYDNNLITVDISLSWNNGDAVNMPYSGNAPDMGAYENITSSSDTTPPNIISVIVKSPVHILFSEPLDEASATNVSNYTIEPGITIYSATLEDDLRTVILTTSDHTENVEYTLTINGVTDVAGNPMVGVTHTYQYSSAIIIDHAALEQFDQIPDYWINEVTKMHLSIPGESHSRAYGGGAQLLRDIDSKYAVSFTNTGAVEPYRDDALRISVTRYDNGVWRDYTGEDTWFTRESNRGRIKGHIDYANNNNRDISAIGFGWCYDMTFINNPLGPGVDPVYNTHWAGASAGGPEGNMAWGLDDGDYALTGNSVNMDTYLNATQEYIDYVNTNNYDTTVIFTTGPVDSDMRAGENTGESGYQRYLKHEHIRNYVQANGGVLFDYADILTYNDAGQQNIINWTDGQGNLHNFPYISQENETGSSAYSHPHIGSNGALKIGKAVWVLMAKLAGWDGTTEQPGNQAPTANAGPDQTVTDTDGNGSEQITLNGSGSSDSDGTIQSYIWREGTTEVANGVNPNIILTVGTHTIALTITDDGGLNDTDTITITVSAQPGNQVPTANAGPDHTVTDSDSNGSEQITLDGSGSSDPDGTIQSSIWREGTNQIATGLNPVVTLNTGAHTITLTVIDNGGLTDTDTVIITVSAQPDGTGIAAWWKFDEGSGNIAQDSSSNGNTATLNGPTWTEGKIDGALNFDGANDYVDCGNDQSLDLTGDFSIGLWFYVRDWNNNGYPALISKRDSFNSMNWQLFYYGDFQNIQFWYGNAGYHKLFGDLNVNPSSGTWHHLFVTREANTWTLYLDGVSKGTNIESGQMPLGDNISIGALQSIDTHGYFNGMIDDVRIYNLALAANEVDALYDEGNAASLDVDRVTTHFETIIELWFNEPFDDLLTEEPGDYTINNGINVHKVALDADNNRVRLFTDVHNTGTDYALNIAGFDTSVNYTYDSGLIGNWKLDDYSGTEAQDSSGNGNSGTLQNGPRWTTQGGISLNGGNDAVEIPTTGWDADSGTLSLWAYAQDLSDTQFFFGHVANSSNRIQLYSVAGNLALGFGDDLTLQTGIETLDTNVWYNLAITWDGTNYSVYVDGIEKATDSYSGLATLNSYADIGNYGLASSRDNMAFDGLIGDVRMYNRAYNPAEVQDLYLTYQVNENRQLALATTEQLTGGSTITYQLQNPEDLPFWATFNDSEGTVTWRPWYDQAGAFELTFAENGQPENTKTYTVVANNITLKDWYRTWLQDINKL